MKINKTQMTDTYEYQVRSFLSNVNKLDKYVHRNTHSVQFGTVSLVKSAAEANNGKRRFSVKKSPILKSGSYTYAGIRERLLSK